MKPALFLITLLLPVYAQDLVPCELQAEYHRSPIALGTTTPRLSWKVKPTKADTRDLVQSTYEI